MKNYTSKEWNEVKFDDTNTLYEQLISKQGQKITQTGFTNL